MKVEILKLDHQGRGIGKIEGKTVFIPNALPSEIVNVKIVKDKKKYCEAEVVAFEKTSEERVTPICPYFGTCGGCDLMHQSYQDQILFKERKIRDIMSKYADISDTKVSKILASENDLYYRNKVIFQVQNGVIGFYEKKSNTVIPISKCYISGTKINKILEKLQGLDLRNVFQIIVRTDDAIEEVMVILYLRKEDSCISFVKALKDDITSLITIIDGKESCLYGKSTMIFELGNYKFELSSTAFFQVNTKQCEKLYRKILELASPSKDDYVLDLYCGTGTIGIYLANFAKQVYGVEIHKGAIENANHNKELNNLENVSFEAGDVSKIVSKLPFKPTIVVVDPPRRGLDEKTIHQILKWEPKKIVYVSCDPMTLARDLNLFNKKYNILEIIPVDMFPNTAHVECVCVLESRKPL